MITQELVAENLLWPLWRSVSDDYKKRYAREIWEHFENAVRSAAYTGKLTTYLANFQGRIPSEIKAMYIKSINSIVQSNQDDLILDWLRDETTYLVMQVRLMNQERKELYEADGINMYEKKELPETDFIEVKKSEKSELPETDLDKYFNK